MNSHLHRELAMVRVEEARRHAVGRRRAAALLRRRPIADLLRRAFASRSTDIAPLHADTELRIRYARPGDASAVARHRPRRCRPLHRTEQLVELMALRAEQLGAATAALDATGRAIGPSEAPAR
jgi:hypothetical protein